MGHRSAAARCATRRLTLPSRGRFPAFGLQAPLMSNVRRHQRVSPRRTKVKLLRVIATALHAVWILSLLAGSAFFAYVFYERYWKWRDCIAQALSSCGIPESDNATSGGAIWLVPSVILLAVAIGGALHLKKEMNARSAKPE